MTALSVCLVTRGSPAVVASWAEGVRAYADEILIAIDAGCNTLDATYAVAADIADQAYVTELAGLAEPAKSYLFERARGEWILSIDDDEMLSTTAPRVLPALLSDRQINSYALPWRWVARDPFGNVVVLRQAPWYPNHIMRLWRNVPGTWRNVPVLHSAPEAVGPTRALDPDGDLALFHFDLLSPRSHRERKIEGYRRLVHEAAGRGERRVSNEEHYLYEDYVDSLAWESPDEDWGLQGSPRDFHKSSPRKVRAPRAVPLTELQAAADRRVSEGLVSSEPAGPSPDQWSVSYRLLAAPSSTTTNRGEVVRVEVTNTSAARWRTAGLASDRVVVGTRWRTRGYGDELPMAGDTLLPRPLDPGESAALDVLTWSPRIPGDYELVVELIHQDHAWFSQFGVSPLVIPMHVQAGSAPAEARHFAGVLPDDPVVERAVGDRVSVEPTWVHDSEQGPVLAGLLPGAVVSGSVVVMRLAGAGPVPADAVRVALDLEVWDADFAGSATVFTTDGSDGPATPTMTFTPGSTASASATVDLGRGRADGRVSLWFRSTEGRGSVQFRVGINGFWLPGPA